jgi:hypothetical protein
VSFELHFGLGKSQTIDSLKVTWASGKVQVLKNVKADQALVLEEKMRQILPQNNRRLILILSKLTPLSKAQRQLSFKMISSVSRYSHKRCHLLDQS